MDMPKPQKNIIINVSFQTGDWKQIYWKKNVFSTYQIAPNLGKFPSFGWKGERQKPDGKCISESESD